MQPDLKPRQRAGERGYSLAELLVSLSMLAILSLAALPSVARITGRARVDDAARQLQQTLSRARMSAINAGHNYVVTFNGGGFNLFSDLDNDGVRDAGEGWVFVQPQPLGARVSWSAPPAAPTQTNLANTGCNCLEFQPLGTTRVPTTSTASQAILLGDQRTWRRITVSTGGAVQVERWIPGRNVWEL